MNQVIVLVFPILILNIVHITVSLQCYNCLVSVNTASYIDCKLMQNIKVVTCPADSAGCAVIRDHPKGKFAEFKRGCIDKKFTLRGTNGYCEQLQKNDTQKQYFNCKTCQGDGCNKLLLK